jgi:cytochrome c553
VSVLGAGRLAILAAALFSPAAFSQTKGNGVQACAACHGPGGNSVTARIPSIAGQPRLFIENQLILFREGLRPSAQMTPLMQGVSDKEIVALAEHFSQLPAKPAPGEIDKSLHDQGQALARKHRCGVCHLPDFSGQKQVPRLAGQREDYLVLEMAAFRDNKRPGGDTQMAAALYGVSDAGISALAHFLARYASRPSGRTPAGAR